ncbi:hypothetical protein [Labrys wisconsinensis]|uniref:Uncharacterized protein n=1 Tax=Labrys wisconsinensis TaxID=425677 RepID=A0ABU0J5T5_9HYPH|nr:hypothetical protein [Labrys wisconsinensis]MDQ0469005.1 hypothetical protein [Labrys wisconsinensis]
MVKRRTSKPLPALFVEAATSAVEIGHASAVTIGHRLPMLMAIPFWPHADAILEAQRMVTEKVAAAVEGSIAASRETGALMTLAALGQANAADMAAGFLTIAVAAAGPARRRARANARRLSLK